MIRLVNISLFFIAFGKMSSCVYRTLEKPLATPEELVSVCVQADTVSFQNHIQPILMKECARSGCHVGSSPEGNLNLENDKAYTQLWQRGKDYIDTVIAERSVLYNSLTSPANLMPPTGKLPDCQIDLIRKWMKQGGRNN
jgi:hypothetical protein